jgi:hypothetical protein
MLSSPEALATALARHAAASTDAASGPEQPPERHRRRPCVADCVRCAGHSDRAHARFASDVNLLCDFDRIIDLDAEVTNGALDLRMH